MRAEAHFITARLPYGLDQLAAVLGHTEQQAKYVRRASCGLPWLYTELNSEEAVVQTRASVSHLKSYCNGLHANLGGEDAREPWLTGLVAFAVVGQQDGQVQIKARVFFDENGTLIEDSATGSAALG
jgi:predicted PhzF superfamily epimerase YddE/YHI9